MTIEEFQNTRGRLEAAAAVHKAQGLLGAALDLIERFRAECGAVPNTAIHEHALAARYSLRRALEHAGRDFASI